MSRLLIFLFFPALFSQSPPEPYEEFQTKDRFGREIHYYLTRHEGEKSLPIILWIQGSGAYSHFLRRGDRIVETVRSLRMKL